MNASYKLPQSLKVEIESIAKKEQLTQGDIVRSFLEFAVKAYAKGRVQRSFSDSAMEHFRTLIQPGDEVIAGGLKGRVKAVGEIFFKVELAEGVDVDIVRDELSDVLNPRKELLDAMREFHASQKGKA